MVNCDNRDKGMNSGLRHGKGSTMASPSSSAAGGWPWSLTSTRVGFSQWGMSRTVTFVGRMMDSLLWSRHEVAHSDPEGKHSIRWHLSTCLPVATSCLPIERALPLPGPQWTWLSQPPGSGMEGTPLAGPPLVSLTPATCLQSSWQLPCPWP